jgi:hypothetical protein
MTNPNWLYLFEADSLYYSLGNKYILYPQHWGLNEMLSKIYGYRQLSILMIAVEKNIPVKEYTNERFIDNVIRK